MKCYNCNRNKYWKFKRKSNLNLQPIRSISNTMRAISTRNKRSEIFLSRNNGFFFLPSSEQTVEFQTENTVCVAKCATNELQNWNEKNERRIRAQKASVSPSKAHNNNNQPTFKTACICGCITISGRENNQTKERKINCSILSLFRFYEPFSVII